LCSVKKRRFFRKIFRRKYLKNHNIGPRYFYAHTYMDPCGLSGLGDPFWFVFSYSQVLLCRQRRVQEKRGLLQAHQVPLCFQNRHNEQVRIRSYDQELQRQRCNNFQQKK
jgi:hypothetical protein